MRAGVIRIWLIIFSAAFVSGCEGPATDETQTVGRSPVVEDSAGVRIVKNGAAVGATWRVDSTPILTIGWGTDEPNFTWPQSGRILPDGGALLGEFGEGTIYRIGPDGVVIGRWGRKGEGPGEYQALDAIVVQGDSVFVSDGRLRRITVISLDGEVQATWPLSGTFLHRISGIFNDGRFLLIPGEAYGAVSEVRPEWVFETQPILAAGRNDDPTDTLVELPHLRRWYGSRVGSPGPVRVKGRAGGLSDGFAWARSDERAVHWYDEMGQAVQVASWEEEAKPLGTELRRRRVQALRESYESRGVDESTIGRAVQQLEEGFERHEGPLPYWESFLVDRSGGVWLSDYTLPGEPLSSWRVFTRDGTLIGWVELPDVVSVLDITNDRILAVRHNEMDVPAVLMLQLTKPTSRAAPR